MNFYDSLLGPEPPHSSAQRFYGVMIGIVTNNQDPDGMGRVKVKLQRLGDEDESNWARIVAPMAGKDRGLYLLPEVNDEVLVGFDQGDPRSPYILGALWNGQDGPPAKNDDGKNNVRVLKSRSGHVIRLTDEDGKEKIEIIDKTEKNSIVFDTANNTITITADKDIVLSAAQGAIRLHSQSIDFQTTAEAKIKIGSKMDVEASGPLGLKGSVVNIN